MPKSVWFIDKNFKHGENKLSDDRNFTPLLLPTCRPIVSNETVSGYIDMPYEFNPPLQFVDDSKNNHHTQASWSKWLPSTSSLLMIMSLRFCSAMVKFPC